MPTPRNNIDTINVIESEVENLDTLYEICDAEFTSREDIHNSFVNARDQKSWANTLRWEVQKIANRDSIQCSQYTAQKIADHIASDWFDRF